MPGPLELWCIRVPALSAYAYQKASSSVLASVVTLYVHQNAERLALSPRRAAWYPKPAPTFADAIARLRQHLWFERIVTAAGTANMTEPISPVIQRIIEAACYAQ